MTTERIVVRGTHVTLHPKSAVVAGVTLFRGDTMFKDRLTLVLERMYDHGRADAQTEMRRAMGLKE